MTMQSIMPAPTMEDLGHSRLKEFVLERTGLMYYANRDEDLAMRVQRRLATLGLRDCASYLQLLQNGQAGDAEFDSLVSELTIGETHFFRHRELFDALRDVILPDLIARKAHARRLRVWSAGCATGPEPYSLSILLKRDLAHLTAGWEISILARTSTANSWEGRGAGRFDDWAFRGCSEDFRRECFDQSGDGWIIKPIYRQPVSFQYHNLVRHPFPSLLHNLAAFDLILCRNVMIYFAGETMRRLIGQFEQCLVRQRMVSGGALGAEH